ncbi:hypothetical protein A5719_04945 [Mycolicibacterium peregrinum]|uniref:hypothetical protein n=1 Tax=Mycolicibacterium peregrinum TaxID=43304 RepID=UPI0007EB8190|nr:hypothetical protein [Mycolicibacterium peregrinum]OBF31042.1 hypothetical protein A5719_04945 [Mycolicibacterium peregrinum]
MRRRRREDRRFAPPPMSRRVETGPDGYDYEVRVVTATRAVKVYRCPGCDHEIRVATAHVVVLPVDVGDVDDRRHWHTACWANRANRGPTRKWS